MVTHRKLYKNTTADVVALNIQEAIEFHGDKILLSHSFYTLESEPDFIYISLVFETRGY